MILFKLGYPFTYFCLLLVKLCVPEEKFNKAYPTGVSYESWLRFMCSVKIEDKTTFWQMLILPNILNVLLIILIIFPFLLVS